MIVSHTVVTAARQGLQGRPGPEIPGTRHLYVGGDWVGPEGMLADAALARVRRAAVTILEHVGRVREVEPLWVTR